MNVGTSISVDRAMQELQNIDRQMQRDKMIPVVLEAGKLVRDEMSRRAPRSDDPPHMADNIEVVLLKTAFLRRVAVGIGVRSKFWYARLIELGTSKMAAQPFARPAYFSLRKTIVNLIGKHVVDVIKKKPASESSAFNYSTLSDRQDEMKSRIQP